MWLFLRNVLLHHETDFIKKKEKIWKDFRFITLVANGLCMITLL